jgi:hypothetical protein
MGELIPLRGTLSRCERCAVPLRVADERNPDAKMIRRSKTVEGVCIGCAVREWFALYRHILPPTFEPTHLLAPHIRETFGALMRASHSDARPEEIDWQHVVDHWHLPMSSFTPAGNLRKKRAARK